MQRIKRNYYVKCDSIVYEYTFNNLKKAHNFCNSLNKLLHLDKFEILLKEDVTFKKVIEF
jgi:hypothetical protein